MRDNAGTKAGIDAEYPGRIVARLSYCNIKNAITKFIVTKKPSA